MTHPTPTAPTEEARRVARQRGIYWHGATGRWFHKTRAGGKVKFRYLTNDPANPWEAIDAFGQRVDAVANGAIPAEAVTVTQLCKLYLKHRSEKATRGEITWGTFRADFVMAARVEKLLGANQAVWSLTTEDLMDLRTALFDEAKLSFNTGTTELTRIKSMLKFARLKKLTPLSSDEWREALKAPASLAVERQREKNGYSEATAVYTPEEVRALLKGANARLKTMILFAINCGFGNDDIGCVALSDLDLTDPQNAWVSLKRSKTRRARRNPLWPRTVEALQEVMKDRPEPERVEYGRLVFLTRGGKPWVYEKVSSRVDSLAPAMRALLRKLKIKAKRRTFYALRHTFATLGENVYPPDPKAVAALMGHAKETMTDTYVHGRSDVRKRRLVSGIHERLFVVDDVGQPAWEDLENLPENGGYG